jgi:hypothetical protein
LSPHIVISNVTLSTGDGISGFVKEMKESGEKLGNVVGINEVDFSELFS